MNKQKERPRNQNIFRKVFSETGRGIRDFQMFSKNMFGMQASGGDVLYIIDNLDILPQDATTLAKTEKIIIESLKTHFPKVTAKLIIDKELNLKVTADIDHKIGIVCHLAKDLSAAKTMSLIGKLMFLRHRVYNERLMLVIIGSAAEERLPVITEIKKMLMDVDIALCYLTLQPYY